MNPSPTAVAETTSAEEAYKHANEQRYLVTDERKKYLTQPTKMVKVERFKRHCHQILPHAKKVLDIGGGGGNWADILRDEGIVEEVYAIDISPAILKERHPKDVAVVGDMENLPFENSFFDASFFFAALHHVAKTERALSEAARVTKDDGYLMLYEPVSLRMRFKKPGIEPTPDGVEFCYSLPYVLNALDKTGWKPSAIIHEGSLRRWLRGRGSVTWMRRLAILEEQFNHIPVLRSIMAFWSEGVLIVAKKK